MQDECLIDELSKEENELGNFEKEDIVKDEEA